MSSAKEKISPHIAYGIPRYLVIKKLTFLTFNNDEFNWSENRAYMAGKWKLLLNKNKDGRLVLNKEMIGDVE